MQGNTDPVVSTAWLDENIQVCYIQYHMIETFSTEFSVSL